MEYFFTKNYHALYRRTEVLEAENMFFDKIWFDRHLSLEYRIEQGTENINPEIWQGAMEAARKVIEKYGEENLELYSDF